ncbi:YfhO family protein [Patescibacteria group bacterium]|nr:YfhO family protein [Patescibacteria group bacterium]
MKQRWPLLLLVLLTVVFFSPSLIRGEGFLYADNFSHQLPTLSFWKQEILKGKLPLWNPYILGGIPFLADLSHNTLSPTNVLYLLLPIPVALTILVLVYIGIAAAFTYLYIKAITGKIVPSLFSAVAFAFSGTVIAAVNDINSLQGIAFIPVVMFVAHKWMAKKDLPLTVWLIAVLTLQFISSHPQYSYYTWMMVAAYILVNAPGKLRKNIRDTFAIFATVFALSAVQLIPFLEFTREAFRPETSSFATQNQLQIKELPRFVLANFYGSWRQGSSWGPGAQLETGLANTEGYLGLLPLMLAAMAALTNTSRHARFWMAAALLSFLLSLGSQTPIYELARGVLPLFSKFRSPIRILSVYSFAVATLAGLTLAEIKTKGKR